MDPLIPVILVAGLGLAAVCFAWANWIEGRRARVMRRNIVSEARRQPDDPGSLA